MKNVKTDHGRTAISGELSDYELQLDAILNEGLSKGELREIENEAENETYSTDTLFRLIQEVKRLRNF